MGTIRFRVLGCLLLFAGCCGNECRAQIVRLSVSDDSGEIGKATAVCIGQCDGGSVFLTARHNFRDATRARVKIRGNWIRVRSVNRSRSHDVASFEVEADCDQIPLADEVQPGVRVRCGGFGPEYWGSGEAGDFHGTLMASEIHGDGGLHPIQGDSGGPVIADDRVVGIVCGYVSTVARTDDASRNYPTVYAGLSEIRECLQQVYRSCPPGGCPIYIRPEIRQPVVGIGIPVGPPQVVGVATPVPPQRLEPRPDPISIIGPRGERGPAGPVGPQGPPGQTGRPVSQEQVEIVVNAWLESNIDRIKGPPGDAANCSALESRVTALESRKLRVIVSSENKIVDDESYDVNAGEPVVLNLKRLTNSR